MTESARVKVLNAEIRVLQVGNGQITRSIYRQLDEVSLERFEPFGRVKDKKLKSREGALQLVGRDTKSGALVRHDAQPPDWSRREGPSEFSHWLGHTKKSFRDYPVAVGRDGRRLVWFGSPGACPAPYGWHVTEEKPPMPMGPMVMGFMGERTPRPWSEEDRAKGCTVDLVELERAWRAKARAELVELLEAQAEYKRLEALPLIVLPN